MMEEFFPRLNERGEEIPDPTPIARALKIERPVSTLDELREAYRLLQWEAERNGFETPEEANDFDIDEDPVPDAPFAANLDNIQVREIMDALGGASEGSGGVPPASSPSVAPGGSGGPANGTSGTPAQSGGNGSGPVSGVSS